MPGINLSFNNTDILVSADLEWIKNEAVIQTMMERMTFLMRRLQEKARAKSPQKYLEQDPNHPTIPGALRASIRTIPTRIEGSRIVGGVTQDQSIAPYGAFFEFGGKRMYIIRPIGKPAPEGSRSLGGSRRHEKGAVRRFGKDILRFYFRGKYKFATYVFHPPIPKIPFMAPALEEMYTEIVDDLRAALIASLRKRR